MQPSQERRLSVAKPDREYRERRARKLLGDDAAPPSREPASESTIQIEVSRDERRPFELADLLSREFIARNNSFLISLAVHTLILLLLSYMLIQGTGKAMIVLQLMSSPDLEKTAGVIAEIDVDLPDSEQLLEGISNDLADGFGFDDLDGQRVSPNGSGGGKEGNARGRLGDGKSAKFFGMRAAGNRFVYVLDRSGSMGSQSQRPEDKFQRFDVARAELMSSVESLQPHQEFYVVLFSTGLRRMFDDRSPISKPIKATPENKSRLRSWLANVRADGGTDPRKSLNLAYKMRPDAIFMLSDGEFRDEKKDDSPKSLEIAKEQMANNNGVQINSIAFEDQRSKANMKELADATGGQFRFVRVNDFIDEMLQSPDQIMRVRAMEQFIKKGLDGWDKRREFVTSELIPCLQSESVEVRKSVETMLHELSFGVFQETMPSVIEPESNLSQRVAAKIAWTNVWSDRSELDPAEIPDDVAFFLALASGKEDELVRRMGELDVTTLSPLKQIAFAERILEYQESNGVTGETRQLLLNVFEELNKESTAKFGRDFFLKNATQVTCQARLKKVLANRRIFARRLYRKWESAKPRDVSRIEYARKIVELYPETKYAAMMKDVL